MPIPPRPTHGHRTQLDALRTLAVAAVMASHFLNRPVVLGADVLGDGAYLGVRLFFVLSGFLITGLLLDSRRAIRTGRTRFRDALGHFYVRRALRILPLYFLVVAVTWVLDVGPARRALGWFLTFTYNLHLMRQGWWDPLLAHVWSLSVEQQFYLVWPWLVLLAPGATLVPLGLAMVGVGWLTKYYYAAWTGSAPRFYVSPLSSADALGAGALVAMLARSRRGPLVLDRACAPAVVCATLALTLASPWWMPAAQRGLGYGAEWLYQAVQVAAFAGLIHLASRGIGGPVGALLDWRPLVYLGTISYGLYVYHPLMPSLASLLPGVADPQAGRPGLPMPLVAVGLSVVMAAVSWHGFEKPINDLKRHFR